MSEGPLGVSALWLVEWSLRQRIPGYSAWALETESGQAAMLELLEDGALDELAARAIISNSFQEYRGAVRQPVDSRLPSEAMSTRDVVRDIVVSATCTSRVCYIEDVSLFPAPQLREGEPAPTVENLQRMHIMCNAAERDPDLDDFEAIERMRDAAEAYQEDLLDRTSRQPSKATVFLSHSWACPWWNLVHSAVLHSLSRTGDDEVGFANNWTQDELLDRLRSAALRPTPQPYYWIDIFSKNQHVVQSEATMDELVRAVESSGEVMLAVHPWPAPLALSRVWCLFEILTAVQCGVKLCISPSFAVVEAMFDSRSNAGISEVMSAQTTPAEGADATVATDKQMILGRIERTCGFEAMNATVQRAVQQGFEATRLGILSSYGQKSADGMARAVELVR